jgi:SAM-dependent methyltransferase
MYRVRREVFLREAAALGLDPHSARVLDVGSGTGFSIRRWLELGVGSITGCDLAESAVERLRSRSRASRSTGPASRIPTTRYHGTPSTPSPASTCSSTSPTTAATATPCTTSPTSSVPADTFSCHAHVDAPRVRGKAWGALLRGVTLTRPTGWLAGAALFPAERRLVRRVRESPTTELLVCRRPIPG